MSALLPDPPKKEVDEIANWHTLPKSDIHLVQGVYQLTYTCHWPMRSQEFEVNRYKGG